MYIWYIFLQFSFSSWLKVPWLRIPVNSGNKFKLCKFKTSFNALSFVNRFLLTVWISPHRYSFIRYTLQKIPNISLAKLMLQKLHLRGAHFLAVVFQCQIKKFWGHRHIYETGPEKLIFTSFHDNLWKKTHN